MVSCSQSAFLHFKQFNQLIRDFLWNGEKPRINIHKLYTARNLGGLMLPNSMTDWLNIGIMEIIWVENELAAPLFGPIEVCHRRK